MSEAGFSVIVLEGNNFYRVTPSFQLSSDPHATSSVGFPGSVSMARLAGPVPGYSETGGSGSPQERSRRAPAGRAQPAAAGAALSGRRRQRERPAPESARAGPGVSPADGPREESHRQQPVPFSLGAEVPLVPSGRALLQGRRGAGGAGHSHSPRGVPGIDPFPLPEICWE